MNATAGRASAALAERDGRAGSLAGRVWGGLIGPLRSGRIPAFAVCIGCLLLLFGFFRSPDFQVDRVVITGLHLGRADEVALTTGAIEGPVFQVDADAIAARVAALPYVARVQVRAKLPDQVVIAVTERVPVAVWSVGGQLLLVDVRGNVLAAGDDLGLPHVTADGTAPAVGSAVPAETVAASVAIQRALGERLHELQFAAGDGLIAHLDSGHRVIFGTAERLPAKLEVLDAVMQHSNDWILLDLRDPDRPYYR